MKFETISKQSIDSYLDDCGVSESKQSNDDDDLILLYPTVLFERKKKKNLISNLDAVEVFNRLNILIRFKIAISPCLNHYRYHY